MNNPSFGRGARGFVVSNLQRALKVIPDGDFGGMTEGTVMRLQSAIGVPTTGRADARVFRAVDMPFPGELERCLNITDVFEGTGFGGINRKDIDGAGVTLGIVGFTTHHNEVQRLVREYVETKPQCLQNCPASMRDRMLALCANTARNTEAWDNWFYGNDAVVDSWIRDIVREWGKDPLFQKIQMDMIVSEMWTPVKRLAEGMGITSLAGIGLLFDVRVQNGGFSTRHLKHYHVPEGAGELTKLRAIAKAVSDCADSEWRQDVFKRKMVFAEGRGTVHGISVDLDNYGF